MFCKDRKFIFIAYPFVKKMFGAPLMAGCSANGCVKRANGRCDEPTRTTSSVSEVTLNGQRTGEAHRPTTA